MNRREWAEENGYEPSPEEQDRIEPSRSYRGPRGPVVRKPSEPWADGLAVALGEYDPWADEVMRKGFTAPCP